MIMDKTQKRLAARIESKVRRAVERHALWPPGATVIAAVSGGADSLCLLGTLDALRLRGVPSAPGRIVIAHLDHRLRGADGGADAAFVAELAGAMGLECIVRREEVATLARRDKRSLEDAARRARYAFLRRVAAEVAAERIATGHTRDDQAETVLMHLLRGGGLSGLAGMAPLAGDIARPLLDVTRAETEAYCAARGWTSRHDASNDDPAFLRTRVRRTLLPLLERENPHLRDTLARNAALIAADAAYLDALARDAWDRVVTVSRSDAISFDLAALRALPAALRSRLLREAQRRLTGGDGDGDGEGLEARHVEAAEEYILRGQNGTARELPGGLRLVRDREALTIERVSGTIANHDCDTPPHAEPVALPVPGEVALPGLGMLLRARLLDAAALPEGALQGAERDAAYADADQIGTTLAVRAWRPGDRFRPLGMAHEKKLQDYFTDGHVPRAERAHIPLVLDGERVIWVAGQRLDDRVRVTPQTRRVLELTMRPL